MNNQKLKLISQLSKETGVPVGTIRFYEKSGLFKGVKTEKTTNNYVYYDDEIVSKLEFIKEAKSVGFTLSEIKEVIEAWYEDKISKARKLEVLDKKLLQIDLKIKELKVVKKQIAVFKSEIENDKC